MPYSSLLVTGGAGFIGSHFVDHWLDTHPDSRVTVLDLLTYAGRWQNLAHRQHDPRFHFVRGDIRDGGLVTELLTQHDVDALVHFAAESHVDRSIDGPGAFTLTNVYGTQVLLEAARQVWEQRGALDRCRFHHVSTDEVYGDIAPETPPVSEQARYLPSSPYAASKAASDMLVRAWHRTYDLDVTLSHCSNNYGPRQYPEKLIPVVLASLLRNRSVPVYGDGLQRRDWISVWDHCRGVEAVLTRGLSGQSYNLGGADQGHGELTNLALITHLCELVEQAFLDDPALSVRYPEATAVRDGDGMSLLQHVTDRRGHDRRYALDCGKAQRELNWHAQDGLSEGLAQTVHWYLKEGYIKEGYLQAGTR